MSATKNQQTVNDSPNVVMTLEEAIITAQYLIDVVKSAFHKKSFQNSLEKAQENNSLKKIQNIILTVGKYISNEKNKKRTFTEVALDFIHSLSQDIVNIPNVDEYFEKVPFPDTTDWKDSKDSPIKRKPRPTPEMYKTKRSLLVYGETQTGKEKFTIGAAIKSLLENRIPIIVTRRLTADANKLERSIKYQSIAFNKFMKDNGIDNQPFEISCIRKHKICSQQFKGENPSIIVVLGTKCQLSKVLQYASLYPGSFDLYIDEADDVDYGLESQACGVLKRIKELSYNKYAITATPLTCILSEPNMKATDCVLLSRPDDYRGVDDIIVKLLKIDENSSAVNKKSTYDEMVIDDKNLIPFLDTFSNSFPEYVWKMKQKIPNICLLKNSRIVENQDAMMNGIIDNYPSKFAVISFNGEGIKMFFDGMTECVIDGKVVKPKEEADIDITAALQYLKDNGGVKKFPRIIIISGNLAGRCISFVSRDYDWHTTDMYYNPAKSTCISDMIQAFGRLTGRNKGKSHLHFHCIESVAEALYNGYHSLDESIKRAFKSPTIENKLELSFAQSLKNVKMNHKKLKFHGRKLESKIGLITKKIFDVVKGDDNGYNLSEYKYKTELPFDIDSDDDEIIRPIVSESDLKLKKKIGKSLSGPKNSSTSIFYSLINPNQKYTREELVDILKKANFKQPSAFLTSVIKPNMTYGPGHILKISNGFYMIRDEIKSVWFQ
jgi:hypothetical protein